MLSERHLIIKIGRYKGKGENETGEAFGKKPKEFIFLSWTYKI